MKLKNTIFKGFAVSNPLLLVVSTMLLFVATFMLFNKIQQDSVSSEAYISNVWTVWGNNSNSQFCNGTSISSNTPTQLPSSGDIVSISGGKDHVLALKTNNTVKSCGDNSSGQLGDTTVTNRSSFVDVSGLSDIIQVVAGDHISYALTWTGTVYQWGDTISGLQNTPVLISGLSNITSIATSEKTLLALDTSNNLYAYGLNANGESGNGSQLQISTPVMVDTGVSFVKCSKEACAIIKSGQVFVAGNNSKKELATPSISNRTTFGVVNTQRLPDFALNSITKLASGPTSHNFFALDNTGFVWTWGDAGYLGYSLPGNIDGDLAAKINALTSISDISGAYPLALRASGSLYTWTNTTPTLINTMVNVTKIPQSSGNAVYVNGDLFNPLTVGDIPTVVVACTPIDINQTTTCTFSLPSTKDLPNSFSIGIGNATTAGSCSVASNDVTCINVPSGTVDGAQPVYMKIGVNPKVATLSTVNISKTKIGNSNIAFQSGVCTPSTVFQGQSTNCTFPLIGSTGYRLPTNGLRSAITNISGDSNSIIGPSDPCTVNGTNLVCNNTPTVMAGNVANVNSHEVIVYEPTVDYFYNKAVITIDSVQIGLSNIAASSDCINSNSVQLGNTYNCTFDLSGSSSNAYTMPVGGIVAKTSSGPNDSPLCVILNNGNSNASLSCNLIPTTGAAKGVQNVLIKVGSSQYTNRGGVTIVDDIGSGELGNLDINCNDSVVNSTTSCVFTIPPFTAYSQITLSVGDTTPGGNCTVNANIVTCTSVPTGPTKGNVIIYAKLPSIARINTGRTGLLTKIYDNGSVPSSTFVCGSALIEATTTCTFNLPNFETLGVGFGVSIGNATPVTNCSASGTNVSCTNVNTGSSTGDQVIFAGTGTVVDTGEKAFINRPLLLTDLNNFRQLVSLDCSPDPVSVFSNTNCTGLLPNEIVYGSSTLKLKIIGENASTCTFSGQGFTCQNLGTGSTAGNRGIQASLNGSTFIDTGLTVNISSNVIGDAELSNYGNPAKEQVFSNIKCGTNNIVYADTATTCTIEIARGWVIFPGFKMSVEVEPPGGVCVQNDSLLTCVSVPVTKKTTEPGVLFLTNKSGQTIFIGVVFKVSNPPDGFQYVPPTTNPNSPIVTNPNTTTTPTPPTQTGVNSVKDTPRSGGLNIIGLIVLFMAWLALFYKIFFITKIKFK